MRYTLVAPLTIVTAKTLFAIKPHVSKAIRLVSVTVTNRDVDTNEQMDISIARITTIGTPTYNVTPTEAKHNPSAGALSATYGADVTAGEPTYATTPIVREGVPSLRGLRWVASDEVIIAPFATGIEGVGIYLNAAVTSFSGVVVVEVDEIG